MATLDKYGYRQYLRDKGFNDDDITYDQNTQSVMAKGKFFGNATPEADGSTYNTKNNLDSLYRSYQTQNMPSFQDRSGALLDQAQQKLSQPAKPFEYNAYADPLYHNALMAAQTGAATQQGNTLAKLRSMGQGKSSYSEGVAQQIGQQAVADVNARVLPELTAQAYQRYLGEQQMNRQNFGDTLQLAGTYRDFGQQELDNRYRQNAFDYGKQIDQRNFDYQAGRDQVGDQRFDQEFQYRQARDQIADEQDRLRFDEDVRRYGLDYALRAADNARQTAAEARATGNSKQAQLFDIWDRTGVAPAGIPGVQQGTPIAGKQATPKDPTSYISVLDSRFVTKDPYTGEQRVNNPEGLRHAIVMLNLTDEETDQLLTMYGLPINQ